MNRTVDVCILGAGTAGLTARRSAESAGASVVMADPGPLGTTCARVGCMPSKLLIAAAELAHHIGESEVFGIRARATIDGPAVLERVRRERDRFVSFVLESTDALSEREVLLRGRGRLVGPNTVSVTGPDGQELHRIEARSVVIATGSSPFVPPPFRGLGDALLLNDDLFDLADLPRRVLVVGAGVIGVELGQALRRLGSEVTLVDLNTTVGPLSDPKMIREAVDTFSREFPMFLGYTLDEIRREEDGSVLARWRDQAGEAHSGRFDRVLMAAGRRPNLSGLGLEQQLGWDGRGVPAFDPTTMQIGDSPYFLAGDVNNDRPLLHEAADEGQIAGDNAARWPNLVAQPRRTPLGVVFSDPQIGVVGRRWASMACDEHRVGEVDYGDQGRARVMNQHRGRVRIYGEAGTGLLLGAEMLGPRVEHTAHLLAWAIQQRLTVREALAMPFYHPVVEEGIRTALRDLESKLRLSRPPGAPCDEFGPGT